MQGQQCSLDSEDCPSLHLQGCDQSWSELAQVISAIENGQPLLMENLPEDIDAVLDPVIGKLTFKRGRNLILKVGDAEVEYDPNFRCVLSYPAT